MASKDEQEMFYRLKWVDFMGNRMPIVLQNENGPCPLLAVGTFVSFALQVFHHRHARGHTHDHMRYG
eukprot:7849761-Pyramimonas_sp.AAC.1